MRKVALCWASYKGSEPEVVDGLVRMAFSLGRRTGDMFAPFCAKRKQAHLAANHALQLMENAEEASGERFTHVLWIDDDVVVDAEGTLKLLDSVDDYHPVVFALAFERQNFLKPAIWRSKKFNGSRYGVEQILEWPEDELLEVYASGLCFAAFNRDVFDAIKKPYFDWVQKGYARNSVTPDGYICAQFEARGIPVYCHTGVEVGHMALPKPIRHEQAFQMRDRGLWSVDEKQIDQGPIQ
ncbi:MAG: hypothetical protein KGY81_08090 [Phycisphaerae bacterium]|nr:hypothetical protein [Phycisphaerae bacterium]